MSIFFEGKKVFFIFKMYSQSKMFKKYNIECLNLIFFLFSLKFLHNKHALSNL